MRYADGSEVAQWGVNYYVPFSVDYQHLKEAGLDHKAEIRKDLAHFQRLGLTSIRLHCFDRQISDREGALKDNHHLELLDYLIVEAAKRNLYTMLTPIAWWGGTYAADKEGFSNRFTMPEMTSKKEAWAIQARFLKEFGEHVNSFNGKRYADDPAISCFELINEPLYPANHPDEQIVAYINALADGLRASGTKKPIFYNSWQRKNAAASRANIQGVTGSYYPTGLVAGHTLKGPQLGKIAASTLAPRDCLRNMAKVIYEFDAADTASSYMYPTFARLFRSEGVQIANMFQYDPLALAPVNRGWQTHFLNLVYAPAKAISFAIAGEAFRLWPRDCQYVPNGREHRYPPFRMSVEDELSELITEDSALYSNDTSSRIPSPDRLRRVWGVGSSAVAKSNGNGAYFLDRIADGVWNLQLYPNVATLRDVHSGGPKLKKATSIDSVKFALSLPDLGDGWTVWCNGIRRGAARSGRFDLAPGEYQLTRATALPPDWRSLFAKAGLPEFVAPLGDGFWQPPPACDHPWDYNFLDVQAAKRSWVHGWTAVAKDDGGRESLRLWAHGGFVGDRDAVVIKLHFDDDEFFCRFPNHRFDDEKDALVFHIRGLIPETTKLEVVLKGADGNPWGVNIAISPDWGDVVMPLKSLTYYAHHAGGRQLKPGDHPSLAHLNEIGLCFGTWLFPKCRQLEHGIEISSIRIEKVE